MHTLNVLPNGLKVIVTPLKGTQSVTVLCLVGAGSRYETKELNGISHFLEHMFFKGAKRYKNAQEVSFAIDSVGGDFNAFTGKEYAGYYVKLAANQKEVAFDVIGDMLLNATFLPEEIEKERGVILEEYNMYQDTPMYQVGWDFERLLFGDQPMGWDQIGQPGTIKTLTQAQFKNYKQKLYTPDNAIISIAGNITEKEGVDLVQEYFPFKKETSTLEYNDYKKIVSDKKVIMQHKKTEQGHIIVGFEGLPDRHEDDYVERILSVILGGGMSSRMFLEVREKRGLCYYARTQTDHYLDTGVISTAAGVDLKRVDMAIEAIIEQYKKIQEEQVSEGELIKAKNFMKGKIALRLEDSEEYANLMGRQALFYDEIRGVDAIFKKIDAVTVQDIQRIARELFKEENLRLAMIGPFEGEERFGRLLHY